jgi:hypothetical protein
MSSNPSLLRLDLLDPIDRAGNYVTTATPVLRVTKRVNAAPFANLNRERPCAETP